MAASSTPQVAAGLDPPIPHVDGVAHRWVEVDGLKMHYAEAGEGDPLVLVHGWPQHWWSWRHVIGPLADRYRVICPDLRGMGWSEGSEQGYSWHGMARDLVDLLDEIGVRDFRLIGHDWGLVIGYRACFNWPDRIRQFVALGGIHPWSRDGAPIKLITAAWHVYLIALIGDLASYGLGITERCLRVWRHAGDFTPEEIETYMAVMRQPKCANATKRFDRNVTLHELPHLASNYRHLRSRVPTLHLNGEQDPLLPVVPPSYRKYADDMRLEVIPECGHFIAEEAPERLVERIEAFLDNPDAEPRR
jgi:pimeloyl-ACP methyl ester carboxylesterase